MRPAMSATLPKGAVVDRSIEEVQSEIAALAPQIKRGKEILSQLPPEQYPGQNARQRYWANLMGLDGGPCGPE